MLWGKKTHLGIDLGSDSLKVCTLDSKGTSCSVSLFPVLPDRSSQEQKLEGPALHQRLAALAGELPSKGKSKVHLSLHSPTSASGYLELPKLSADKLQVAIPSAVAREIPHPLHEVNLFPQLVPALMDSHAQGIFFVAVPKAVQEAHLQAFTQAGFEVSAPTPGMVARLRGVTRNLTLPPEQVTALVLSGYQRTAVILLKGPHPYFCRKFRLAGSDFTYAFQMGDQVDWAEAERRKRAYDVSEKDFKVESFVQRWLGEVQRSLTYASQKYSQLVPTQLILSGGTALWKGLAERLSEFLSLPVTRHQWNQLKLQSSSGPSDMALFDEAIGLVCRP
ncbi:MAG: pilus assembly protein PilM [Candidatus Eremiobacteraeota bacterium]|nr:pilus assembly protein PilM [Candidatus Eremiobacteraeota bacterium]MCW5872147.1 pilus assembly protein PilM [Candidatus Eremiobacteraeota bacterium]